MLRGMRPALRRGGLCAWGLLSRYLWFAAPTAPRRARLAPDTADPDFRGLCPPALPSGLLLLRSPNSFLLNLHVSVQRLHAGSARPQRPPRILQSTRAPATSGPQRPLKTLRWERRAPLHCAEAKTAGPSHAPAPALPQAGPLLQASRNLRLEGKESLKYASKVFLFHGGREKLP